MRSEKRELSLKQREGLLKTLKARLEKNGNRRPGIEWDEIQTRLETNVEKLWSPNEMEKTSGEPDVMGFDRSAGEYLFYDFTAESPKGRRSVCYNRKGLGSRKERRSENTAVDMAATIGIELLAE